MMTFIKFLKIPTKEKRGQASLEYIILLSVIVLLTLVSVSSFLPKVKAAIEGTESEKGYFQSAVERITK